MVNYAFKVCHKEQEVGELEELAVGSVAGDVADESSVGAKKAGRPVGSTNKNKLEKEVPICLAMDDMTIESDAMRRGSNIRNKNI